LIEAARSVTSNFAEGFVRCSAEEFAHYLGISLGSLAEVEESVKDGIALGCFSESDCVNLFKFARRATVALVRLRVTQRDRARNSVRSKRKKAL
jgi:four helix bundle protein